MLTTSVDIGKDFVGSTKDDTFLAASKSHWGVGDSIDGGKGDDTLKIMDSATTSFTQDHLEPIGSTMKSIEILDIINNFDITADTTSIDGITHLSTISKGANTSTAAATTDIEATATNGAIIVNGGKDVTVVSKDNNDATDIITVGATTAAAEKVSVTSTGVYDAVISNDVTMGAITIDGGSTVTVTQSAGITAAQKTAALTSVLNDTVAQGAVTVNGGAATTSVTVVQDATVVKVNDTAPNNTANKIGVTAGNVNINDKNAATAADTIATVTLKNYGTTTINSSALSTLNLESTGALLTGTLTLDMTAADTTVLPTTLTVNSKGGSFDTVSGTMADKYTAVNINSSANTTINDVEFAANKTLTVDGAGVTTFTTFTAAQNAALESIVSKGAGLTIGTILDTDVTFTGGTGVENIKIGATTKAITMGAGADKVTYGGALGTGGSVAAGDGEDTIIMTSTQANNAAGASKDSVFNGSFTGFEVLELSDALGAGQIVDLDGINGVNKVVLTKGAAAGTTTLKNLASDGSVTILADNDGTLNVDVKSALATKADVLNLNLQDTIALTGGIVKVDNVETININVDDAAATGSDADTHTLELAANAAKSIVVKGNNGLTLTDNAANTQVTEFDASGVVANGTADTADKLAVTFISRNATTTANVTIKGGAGNDTLTGNAAIDTITGGEGNDTITGGAGADILTGGAGADMFKYIEATDSNGVNADTITDFLSGTDKLGITTNEAITYAGKVSNYGTALTTLDATKAIAVLDTSTSTLYVDLNGDGALTVADLAIKLDVNDLSQTDFEIFGATAGAITGSAFVDTITANAGGSTITGGAGADIMTGGAGTDIFIWTSTQASEIATETGSTAGTDVDFVAGTAGDKVASFTSGTDKLHFKASMVTNAVGTVTDTLKTIASAGVVADTDRFVEITGTAADGTMGTAITLLNGLDTTAVAMGDSFIAFINDGTNGYLYLVEQVSAANTIAAQDVTLIGQVTGVTDIASGDLVSIA